jgi:F0F1-type ATP synthase assembly protein I
VSIIGIQFPVAIALGFFFGRWIDGMFRTAPWATVGFTLCGIAAGFINLFRITAQAERAEQEEARRAAAERALEEGGDDGAEHRGQG